MTLDMPEAKIGSLGAQLANDLGLSFSQTFLHQFILSNETRKVPAGWCQETLNGFQLSHCASLPVSSMLDSNGAHCGWILGIALRFKGFVIKKKFTVPAALDEDDFFDVLTNQITHFSGRYLVLVNTPKTVRVYGDPVGDLGCVYNTQTGVVAASLSLALDRDIIQNPEIDHSDVAQGLEVYGLRSTRDAHVQRLLPNHFLEVATGQQKRFWPTESTDLYARPKGQAERLADQIGSRLGLLTTRLIAAYPSILPLSAGRDSRTILASAVNGFEDLDHCFAWSFHHRSRRDVRMAQQITERLSLPFKHYPGRDPSADQLDLYDLRTGFLGASDTTRSLAISERLPGGHVMVRGNIMEILRATNWARQREGHLNFGHMRKRFRLFGAGYAGDRQKWDLKIQEWCDTLPAPALARVYDMVFLEQLLPHAQGPRLYGTPQNFIVNPFNDRKLLEWAMQVPLGYKRANKVYDRIVGKSLPQLADLPYL